MSSSILTAQPELTDADFSNPTEVAKLIRTQTGRDFLLQSVAGIRAFHRHPDGIPFFTNRLWRLSNLYRFKHIENGTPILLDFTETFVKEILRVLFSKESPSVRIVILKARQIGCTTVCIAILTDIAAHTPGQICGVSNYNEEDVKQTIKDKAHYCLDNSPYLQYLGAKNFAKGLHFPHTNSWLEVEQTGRGRTPGAGLITEFAQTSANEPAKAEEVARGWFAAAEYSPIIAESSSRGPIGLFYEMFTKSYNLKLAGRPFDRKSFIPIFVSWADKQRNQMSTCAYDISDYDEYFQQVERDIGKIITVPQRNWWVSTLQNDFKGNKEGMDYEHPSTPEEAFSINTTALIMAQEVRQMRAEGRLTPLAHMPNRPLVCFWDFGWNDYTAFVLTQMSDTGILDFLVAYQRNMTLLPHFFERLSELGASWEVAVHCLPHDAYAANETARKLSNAQDDTIAGAFRRAGKYNLHKIERLTGTKRSGFNSSRTVASNVRICTQRAPELITALAQVKRRFIKTAGVYEDELERHKQENHLYDCYEGACRLYETEQHIWLQDGRFNYLAGANYLDSDPHLHHLDDNIIHTP